MQSMEFRLEPLSVTKKELGASPLALIIEALTLFPTNSIMSFGGSSFGGNYFVSSRSGL